MATSCVDDESLTYSVGKPESVALQEELNAYDALKSYVDRAANPRFKLGAGISLSEYISRGVMHRLVNANFDEVAVGYEMKHGAIVQANGSLLLANVEKLFEETQKAGLTVYGHTLCWHANQNATYLNSLIAPTEIPGTGGPTWDLVTGANFETDNASNYQSSANAIMSFTAVGGGKGGEGRALKVVNEQVRTNDWESQFFVTFSPAMQVGEKYELSMDVRADAAASFSTQAHTVPGSYKHWDFYGTIHATTEWSTFVKEITISESVAGTGAIAFNLGHNATSYYFDNITLKKFNPEGSGGATGTSVIADFESDNLGKTYPMTNGGSGTVVADPKGSNSRVLNIKGAQTFPQFAVTLPAGITLENCSAVTLSFLGTGSTGRYGQGMRMSINGGVLASYNSPANYGAVDNEWAVGKIVMEIANLSLTAEQKKLNSFTLALGSATGSADYFIDDITIDWESSGNTIEKTPEEKRVIIDGELERWIAGMMEVSKTHVKAWDVVNEPMDDGNPYELKTGVGKELEEDQFYWQDYLGKDYAVRAFELARQYGNPGDILFINDYNLEYNLDKCRGLIEYVKYLEGKGVTVDGIGTQMHITTTSDKEKIVEMLTLLAQTGKLIKISELDMGVGVKTTEATSEHYQAQADMYEFVVKKYLEIIPANQRYGITIWSPKDSPADSYWRAGEPIGLWTEGYNRKPAYSGVVKGLGGM
jgi:GH35 family endo-1,4-beta-xylanase